MPVRVRTTQDAPARIDLAGYGEVYVHKVEAHRGIGTWLTVERAAEHLGMNAGALRKTLERRSTRGPDGVTEAAMDGVRARKFGRSWRVRFSEAWGTPGVGAS